MKKLKYGLLTLLIATTAWAIDMKISQLPLGSAVSTGGADSFPYVVSGTNITKRLTLWDLSNIPTISSTYAPKANPVFTGTVTAPTFVGALTGNATSATNVATTSASTNASFFPLFVASSSNGNQASRLTTGLTFNPSTNSLTTTTFVGALTGAASLNLLKSSNLSDVASASTSFDNISGMSALGDLIYGGTSGTRSKLTGNITTTKKFLTQTGSGSASVAPSWGTLVGSDLPNPSSSTLGGVQSAAPVSNQWINSISTSGVPSLSQPAFTNISGSVAASQLPNPSASTLGGVQSYAAVSNQWINTISTSGVPSSSQPAFSNLSGNISTSQMNSGTSASSSTFFRGDGTWATPAGSNSAPTRTVLTSTGTTTGYMFTITSGNATVGATYTNNSNTFTVLATIAAKTQVFTSGASAPTASGTLTKSTGSGDATLTFSKAQALATYTTPASVLSLKIRGIGGGGGGGGNAAGAPAGGAGTPTAFGPGLLVGNGGGGGNEGVDGGTGGTVSVSGVSGAFGMVGNQGGSCNLTASSYGGAGAPGPWGGAGGGTQGNQGFAGTANSGAGGGGGGGSGSSGSGGGSGGYFDAVITSPAANYVYTIGAGGAFGDTGRNTGGSGVIIIDESYQ